MLYYFTVIKSIFRILTEKFLDFCRKVCNWKELNHFLIENSRSMKRSTKITDKKADRQPTETCWVPTFWTEIDYKLKRNKHVKEIFLTIQENITKVLLFITYQHFEKTKN